MGTEQELRGGSASPGNACCREVGEILESISDAFFSLDDNLVVTYFNGAAETFLGRRRGEVLGKPLFDAFPEGRGSVFEVQYRRAVREKVKLLLLLGETRDKIARDLEGAGVEGIHVTSLEEAVGTAWRRASPGDTVLLSPGCSSFDMFSNYKERGDVFKRAVKTLL